MAKLWKSCPVFLFTLLFLLSLVLTIVILVEMNIPSHCKALKIIVYCVASLLTTCLVTLLFIILKHTQISVSTVIVWTLIFFLSWLTIIILLIQYTLPNLKSYCLFDETEKILVYYIITLQIMCTVGLMVPVCKRNVDTQGNSVPMGDLGSSNYGFTGDSSGGGDCGGGGGGGDGGGCGGDGGCY